MHFKGNWESTVVNVIYNDFSWSLFIKSKCSPANLVTDYNIIVLNKLILQNRKLLVYTLPNPSVNSGSSFAIFNYYLSRDFKLRSFLFSYKLEARKIKCIVDCFKKRKQVMLWKSNWKIFCDQKTLLVNSKTSPVW